jgi:hypothetical protein
MQPSFAQAMAGGRDKGDALVKLDAEAVHRLRNFAASLRARLSSLPKTCADDDIEKLLSALTAGSYRLSTHLRQGRRPPSRDGPMSDRPDAVDIAPTPALIPIRMPLVTSMPLLIIGRRW